MDKLAQFQNALAERLVPAVAELHARPVLDASGRPIVVAGNNALVARLKRADGSDVALRIVASGDKNRDWSVRYAALASLQGARSFTRLPSAMRIIEEEIAFQHRPWRGVAMEWIAGPTLLQAIDRAARAGNLAVIRALSSAFVQLWNDLQALEFVHGDLASQNLLVRANGQLACIDLDGASWRDAPLGPSGSGSPGYRPPTHFRNAAIRDLYGALVLVTSLAALADKPSLRDRFGDAPDVIGGALLFTEWDLSNPRASTVFSEAGRSVTSETQVLLDALVQASVGTESDVLDAARLVPRLRLPTDSGQGRDTEQAGWNVGGAVARMRAHYASTWNPAPAPPSDEPVEDLEPDQWELWKSPESSHHEVSADDLAELKAALGRNNEADIIRIWTQIEHDPHARLFAAEVEAVLAADYERRIDLESRRKRDSAVVAVSSEAASRRIPLSQTTRGIVRRAAERLAVQQKLDHALATGNGSQMAELAVSGELVVLGDTDRRSLQRVLQAIEWPTLQRAIVSDDDVLIVAAFDDELFDNGGFLEDEVRARIDLARARVAWLEQIRDGLRRRSATELRGLMIDPPEGGPERLSSPERRRVRQMIEQQRALHDLKAAIQSPDDQVIVAALNRAERVGARVTDRTMWSQIQHVVERVAVIDELLEASEAQPPDHARIAQLLPTVRSLGLEHDPRLGDNDLVNRLEQHVVKMAHVRRIRAAIARDNDIAIVAASVPDPRHALDMLNEDERNRVAAAIRARRGASRRH